MILDQLKFKTYSELFEVDVLPFNNNNMYLFQTFLDKHILFSCITTLFKHVFFHMNTIFNLFLKKSLFKQDLARKYILLSNIENCKMASVVDLFTSCTPLLFLSTKAFVGHFVY